MDKNNKEETEQCAIPVINNSDCPKCGFPETVASIDSFDAACPRCGHEWQTDC